MELQVIRDKLLSLESESSAGDVPIDPWAAPRSEEAASHMGSYVRNSRQVGATPQAIAIAALKQRALSHPNVASVSKSESSTADVLVSRELVQLEAIASIINNFAQQQTYELLRLKRAAKKATISLRRQGVSTHPQLDSIQQFLAQSSSASVPNIQVDDLGQLSLHQISVNLNQAETEAVDNAKILRRQQNQSATIPFSQPTVPGPTVDDYLKQNHPHSAADHLAEHLYETEQHRHSSTVHGSTVHGGVRSSARRGHNASLRLQKACRRMLARLKRYVQRKNHQLNASFSANRLAETRVEANGDIAHINKRAQFSWMDGIIWFVGAAVIRIVLNALVVNYAILKLPLLIVLVGAISYAIYRIVLSKSTDMSATYRVGTALLGLFLGSLL